MANTLPIQWKILTTSSWMTSCRLLMQTAILPVDSPVLSHQPPIAICAKLQRALRSCALDDLEAHPTKRVLCKRKRVTGQPTSSSNPVEAQLNPLSQEYSDLIAIYGTPFRKFRRLKPIVLLRKLRSRTSNDDSTLRRIGLKSSANSTSTQGSSTLMKIYGPRRNRRHCGWKRIQKGKNSDGRGTRTRHS